MIFADFHLKLLTLTMWAIDLPTPIIWAVATAIVAGLIATQWCSRWRQTAIILHLSAILACGLTFAAYREAMRLPMMNLLTGMTGGPPTPSGNVPPLQAMPSGGTGHP